MPHPTAVTQPVPVVQPTTTTRPTTKPKPAGPPGPTATPQDSLGWRPSCPDFCMPSQPLDLDTDVLPRERFRVLPPDPHRFDGDENGAGSES
jgi:hypothetical protein